MLSKYKKEIFMKKLAGGRSYVACYGKGNKDITEDFINEYLEEVCTWNIISLMIKKLLKTF